MLRKIVSTKDASLVLDLPEDLRNRRIEIIAFAIDDEISNGKKLPASAFSGTLSATDADELREHINQSWNN